MAKTNTPTTVGLKTLFEQTNIYYLGMSVVWSLKTCISLHMKTVTLEKPFFPIPSKIILLLWTIVAVTKRLMVLLLYFAPCFGMFNLLHHYQLEQIQFSIRRKYL